MIINRSGPRDEIIEEPCREWGVEVVLRIPFQREIAEAYSRGECLVDAFPEWRNHFRQVYAEIERRVDK